MVAALLLIAGTLNEISKATCFSFTGRVVCRVETAEPLVALTFDDGPTTVGVESVLPALKRYNAKATFFLVGASTEIALTRRIVAEGHEVGNHSFTHQRMVGHPKAFYDDELRRTDAALVSAGAPKPTLFRPPYGKKLFGLPIAVARNGQTMVMWDSGDAPDRYPKAYAAEVLADVRPGSIVLIHPMFRSRETERQALPLILEGLTRRGYRLVTVSELLRAGRA
ncbi:polysaccharide deacetylase family protein [Sphingomonas piscis]|uniref:Chitooligosaccharide deacetylase n=1 Tax=Sphingomonas piscis TaxID=2714943 RepID=A0A6G7YT07_9SPHN|nr:polysaccharide deacetylase family protein [Sphingomonas piscis]